MAMSRVQPSALWNTCTLPMAQAWGYQPPLTGRGGIELNCQWRTTQEKSCLRIMTHHNIESSCRPDGAAKYWCLGVFGWSRQILFIVLLNTFGDVIIRVWWTKDLTHSGSCVCSNELQPVQRALWLATLSKIPQHLRNLPKTQMHMVGPGHIKVGWLK